MISAYNDCEEVVVRPYYDAETLGTLRKPTPLFGALKDWSVVVTPYSD